MGEAELGKVVGDNTLRAGHPEALIDYPDQIDTSPPYNAIGFLVRPGFNNLCQLSHLIIAQQTPSSGTLPVGQSIRAIFVEPMHPIPQCLAIHPANPRRLCTIHAAVNSRQSKQTAYLAIVAAST